MPPRFTIVGLGESLFDLFPDKQVLGGAPLNVAVHAHQLAAPLGGRGVVASRIGQDDLGSQLLAELRARGMTTDYIQTDPDHDTGKVYVSFKEGGEPFFDIVRGVAWDWLQPDPDLEELARRCEAVCFGSLAQREGQTRNTIYRFLSTAAHAIRLFDVNLRQHYYDQRILRRSCELATVVKLNDSELPIVANVLGFAPVVPSSGGGGDSGGDPIFPLARTLLREFNLQLLALTRGARGTVLFTPTETLQQPPISYPAAPGADAVGAGDACAAGLLVGLLLRWPLSKVLTLANHTGAFVASQPGATPKLPDSLLQQAQGN